MLSAGAVLYPILAIFVLNFKNAKTNEALSEIRQSEIDDEAGSNEQVDSDVLAE